MSHQTHTPSPALLAIKQIAADLRSGSYTAVSSTDDMRPHSLASNYKLIDVSPLVEAMRIAHRRDHTGALQAFYKLREFLFSVIGDRWTPSIHSLLEQVSCELNGKYDRAEPGSCPYYRFDEDIKNSLRRTAEFTDRLSQNFETVKRQDVILVDGSHGTGKSCLLSVNYLGHAMKNFRLNEQWLNTGDITGSVMVFRDFDDVCRFTDRSSAAVCDHGVVTPGSYLGEDSFASDSEYVLYVSEIKPSNGDLVGDHESDQISASKARDLFYGRPKSKLTGTFRHDAIAWDSDPAPAPKTFEGLSAWDGKHIALTRQQFDAWSRRQNESDIMDVGESVSASKASQLFTRGRKVSKPDLMRFILKREE